jgi:hypothetical protein
VIPQRKWQKSIFPTSQLIEKLHQSGTIAEWPMNPLLLAKSADFKLIGLCPDWPFGLTSAQSGPLN